MPCVRASRQVMRPFPFVSQRRSASASPAPGASGDGAASLPLGHHHRGRGAPRQDYYGGLAVVESRTPPASVCTVHDEFARLMGLLKSYGQSDRQRKAASIRNSSVFSFILSHGATEILTFGFIRLSMMRSGIFGYRRSYSARPSTCVHDVMCGYSSLFSSSPWAA